MLTFDGRKRTSMKIERDALGYLFSAMTMSEWMHRRVDRLEFASNSRIRQNTSLDFSIPRIAPIWGKEHYAVIPLIQVRKRPLINFDITGEDQQEISILTSRQTRKLSTLGLLALGDSIIGRQSGGTSLLTNFGNDYSRDFVSFRLSSPVEVQLSRPRNKRESADYLEIKKLQELIVQVVSGDARHAAMALDELAALKHQAAKSLFESRVFWTLANRFAESYYLTGLVSMDVKRHVVKVAFDQRIAGGTQSKAHLRTASFSIRGAITERVASVMRIATWHKLFERACLAPLTVHQSASQCTDVESLHLEVSAPTGLKIQSACWLLRPPAVNKRDKESNYALNRRTHAAVLEDLGPQPVDFMPLTRTRPTRLHSTLKPVPDGYSADFVWKLVPTSNWPVLALGTLLAMLFLQLLVAAFTLRSWEIVGFLLDSDFGGSLTLAMRDPQSATYMQNRAGLLFALLAISVALLVRGSEHPVTKRLLAFPRALLALNCVGLVFSCADLFFPHERLPNWFEEGVFGALCLALVSVAVFAVVVVRVFSPVSRALPLVLRVYTRERNSKKVIFWPFISSTSMLGWRAVR